MRLCFSLPVGLTGFFLFLLLFLLLLHLCQEKLILRCGWSADGKSIACGSSDAMVNVWNVERNEHVYALPGHRGTVTDVVFHPTEPVVASCGIDGQIYLGELEL